MVVEGVVVMDEDEEDGERTRCEVTDGGSTNGAKLEPAKHGRASRFRKLIYSMTLSDKSRQRDCCARFLSCGRDGNTKN
jgi:hypothetical protein